MFDSSTKGTPERAGPIVTHVRSRPRGFSTSGVPRHVMPRRASNQIFAHTVLLARKVAQQLWQVRLLRYQQLSYYIPGLIDSYFDFQDDVEEAYISHKLRYTLSVGIEMKK